MNSSIDETGNAHARDSQLTLQEPVDKNASDSSSMGDMLDPALQDSD